MSSSKKGNFLSSKLRKILTIMYIAILVSSSTMVLLDSLVISRSYASFSNENVSSINSNNSSNSSDSSNSNNSSISDATEVSSTTAYEDNNKKITIKTYDRNSTKIYVAFVTIKDDASINTALAYETYGRNVTDTTSNIAKSVNAVLAINGDFYGARDSGYVIRNGQLLRNSIRSYDQEDLVIYKDGSIEIIKEGDISAEELLENGAVQVFSFGPALIEDSEIAVDSSDEVGRAMASNPRTAIGIIDENNYVFVVSDGRTYESEGLTLKELAEFMQELNVKTAYNLDGGGSSTMYFNGQIVNNPTTNGRSIEERSVSDIVYL